MTWGKVFTVLAIIAMVVSVMAVLGAMHLGAETFSLGDQIVLSEKYPGGRFTNGNTTYQRCEAGGWVLYWPSGRRSLTSSGCWR